MHKFKNSAILIFMVFKANKKQGTDLAQPPPIAWRDKQVIVEETPVLEAVCKATMSCSRRRQPATRRHQEIPGVRSPEFLPAVVPIPCRTCPHWGILRFIAAKTKKRQRRF